MPVTLKRIIGLADGTVTEDGTDFFLEVDKEGDDSSKRVHMPLFLGWILDQLPDGGGGVNAGAGTDLDGLLYAWDGELTSIPTEFIQVVNAYGGRYFKFMGGVGGLIFDGSGVIVNENAGVWSIGTVAGAAYYFEPSTLIVHMAGGGMVIDEGSSFKLNSLASISPPAVRMIAWDEDNDCPAYFTDTGWVDLISHDGADGADGNDGADGLSAYEVAVALGFVGDETAWLLSLHGADGADGAYGSDDDDLDEMKFKDDWQAEISYTKYDVVRRDNLLFLWRTNVRDSDLGEDPLLGGSGWQPFPGPATEIPEAHGLAYTVDPGIPEEDLPGDVEPTVGSYLDWMIQEIASLSGGGSGFEDRITALESSAADFESRIATLESRFGAATDGDFSLLGINDGDAVELLFSGGVLTSTAVLSVPMPYTPA